MKKITGVLIVLMMVTSTGSHAQPGNALTNQDIVRLVKASLSDALISEFIRSTPVQFDLSPQATASLTGSGVSAVVVDAMRSAEAARGASAELSALAYVNELKGLIPFYKDQYTALEGKIRGWDAEIRRALLEAGTRDAEIRALEAELRLKKSSDPLKFSKEMLAARKDLDEKRAAYKKLKEKMVADGERITGEISKLGSTQAKALGKEYGTVATQVKAVKEGPESGERPGTITVPKFQINEGVVDYLKPVTEWYYWDQNALDGIMGLVQSWNPKVSDLVKRDAALAAEMQPLQQQMEALKSDPKKNKNEISTLKKKLSDLEKQREKLVGQMEDDRKALASALDEAGAKLQEALEERISDIVANIGYAFREKPQL